MKAVLEFNLPEEKVEFTTASNAASYFVALEEFAEHLRRRLKYEENSEVVASELEKIRTEFFNILEDNNIDLYA